MSKEVDCMNLGEGIEENKRLCRYDSLVQYYLESRPLSKKALGRMLENLVKIHHDEAPSIENMC